MGQTLSHGVYLPAEGERNCYSGLASNWNLLDTAIGDTAGKASATHTHGNISNDGKVGTTANVPLITGTGGVVQAGAFGNAANTFCEGNDSRLSDARTPVAHTHGKADITNLFNSANIWSESQTYNITGDVPIKITNGKDATNPSATEMKDIRFSDVNGKIIGGVRHSLESGGTSKMYLYSRSFSSDGSSNSNHGLLIVNNKQTGVREVRTESNFIPSVNNSYDLGSSSYQWNNIYAKNYYYNGVAWGLDKANSWTNFNKFNGYRLQIKHTSQEIGVIPTSNQWNGFQFVDKNNNQTVAFEHAFMPGETRFKVNMVDNVASHNSNSTVWIEFLRLTAYEGGSGFVVGTDLSPLNNNLNLGISTNKWKTLNGINPGALSLPDSANSVNIDITNWNKRATNSVIGSIAASMNGWINVQIQRDVDFAVWVIGTYRQLFRAGIQSNGKYLVMFMFPVTKNATVTLYTLPLDALESDLVFGVYRFYPCLGNV